MWHRLSHHCPLCGALLVRAHVEGRDRARCSSCTFVLFENPASAAAGVVIDERRRVLLVRRAIEPFRGSWALPAGYQEIDEDPRATVVREIREESGIEVEVGELFDLLFVLAEARKPANLAVYLCRPRGGILKPGHDALEAAWFDLTRLPEDLGFDNGPRILHRLRERGG
ncbi:MAG: NUDIX domain-containing protein [Planctomycetes bacterium]|nr:NUDIX domain-containing protein [Planctomycetota bacterium]